MTNRQKDPNLIGKFATINRLCSSPAPYRRNRHYKNYDIIAVTRNAAAQEVRKKRYSFGRQKPDVGNAIATLIGEDQLKVLFCTHVHAHRHHHPA